MLASLDPILFDLAVLFAICVSVAVAFHRLRIPPVVGFVAVGAAVGPYSLGLVQHQELVEQLAEVGVVVLLFTVGMELSWKHLQRMQRAITVAGSTQVVGTVVLGAVGSLALGLPAGQAVFVGFLLALSSTAAVTKLLTDRGEIGVPAGRIGVGICIAQDLAVVAMVLCVPLLRGGGDGGEFGAFLGVLQAFALMVVTLVAALIVVPRVLDVVARTRSRELFLLTVFTVCLSIAVVTASLGLSLALGALLAGVVFARSDYHQHAQAEVEPFRDALSSLFFVSIGMLFDYGVILELPWVVAGSLAAVVIGKALVTFGAVRLMGMPNVIALRSALMLAQVGEFSFVLVQIVGDGLLPEQFEKVFIAVAVVSIAITPLLFAVGKRIMQPVEPIPDRPAGDGERRGHVIVVGYGPVGQNLVYALQALSIPFVVVEMNADTVRKQKALGLPILFGDITRPSVLRAAGIHHARLLVLAVNDTDATQRAAAMARRMVHNIHVLARATYLSEVPILLEADVDEVVPQELETSIEVMVRVLRHFLVADDEVGRQVRDIRDRGFGLDKLAPIARPDSARIAEYLPGLALRAYRVEAGSRLDGTTLADAALRKRFGISVVALRRGDASILQIGPETALVSGDIAVVLGTEDCVDDAALVFRGSEASTVATVTEAHEPPAG